MSKVYNYLRFRPGRAGKIVSGEGAAESGVRRGQVLLLLIGGRCLLPIRTASLASLAQNHNVSFLVYA